MTYQTPEEYIKEIRTALSNGEFPKAQQLSTEALKHYPEHQEIKECGYILAPSKITVTHSDPEQRKQQAANRDWIKQNRANYRNRWIGVRNGELLADARSFEELVEQLDNSKDVLLTVLY